MLRSEMLRISVFSLRHKTSFKKILNKTEPKINPCGTPKKISNHELQVESSLTV